MDKFVIRSHEKRKQKRSYNTQRTETIVRVKFIEKKKIKQVYAQFINDYSAAFFVPFFKQHIERDAQVITDKWTGYTPLKKDYKITPIKIDSKKNFEKFHLIFIR